ncbi:MAG: hypothetical protein AAF802_33480, partial [Planctomycetota bacterium]
STTHDDDDLPAGQQENRKTGPIRKHVARAISDINDDDLPRWLENADTVLSWYEADPPCPKNTKRRQVPLRCETAVGCDQQKTGGRHL